MKTIKLLKEMNVIKYDRTSGNAQMSQEIITTYASVVVMYEYLDRKELITHTGRKQLVFHKLRGSLVERVQTKFHDDN